MLIEPATAAGTPRTGWTRPVAVPADIADSRLAKANGIIELPLHVSWSGPRINWDLADRRQRARVYEIVLSEGTHDDVRRFIDVDQLVDLWEDLWLAPHVRQAWADQIKRLGRVRRRELLDSASERPRRFTQSNPVRKWRGRP